MIQAYNLHLFDVVMSLESAWTGRTKGAGLVILAVVEKLTIVGWRILTSRNAPSISCLQFGTNFLISAVMTYVLDNCGQQSTTR